MAAEELCPQLAAPRSGSSSPDLTIAHRRPSASFSSNSGKQAQNDRRASRPNDAKPFDWGLEMEAAIGAGHQRPRRQSPPLRRPPF